MATPSKVHLDVSESPEYHRPGITQESAKKASELLQENHEIHHIFFNQSGFHNHIAHHLLTIYALNTPPNLLQKQYDNNKSYQRSPEPLMASEVSQMHDPEHFKGFLGNERYYHDFLKFFQDEMEEKGWENVLNEYLFAADERADDMLARLLQLLDEVHTEKSLAEAAKNGLPNRIREGILAKAADTMINIVKQYRVQPGQLEEETAAMTNAAAYFTGAAQHPPKVVKMDFFYMHCINCSIFFSAFLKQSWLSEANKVRLLEWKVRNDLIMYASRGSPNLLLDEVVNYKPKKPSKDAKDPWDDIIDRVRQYEDDGHGAKLVRALAHGQKICEPYEDRESFRIKKNMWLQLGHMAIDSVEGPEPEWVRGCGFDDAWEKVADRPRDSMEAEDHPKQSKAPQGSAYE
ncbi:hypothetical protein H2203_004041 [Taxawa tesnikishii (nom. ined.)]|nr:hypothetical protein H2203_004041 [Dothideales sp. JES 119]